MAQLQYWQNRTIVGAAKIVALVPTEDEKQVVLVFDAVFGDEIEDEDGGKFTPVLEILAGHTVDAEWALSRKADVGAYFVDYNDEADRLMSAAAFEAQFVKVTPTQAAKVLAQPKSLSEG